MLRVDSLGYLEPHEVIDASLDEIEQILVSGIAHSSTRARLFENYRWYVQELRTLTNTPFKQWLDGSFATLKTNPNDLDVVTFLDFESYGRLSTDLDRFQGMGLHQRTGLDCYFVKVFPEGHPNRILVTEYDTADWKHLFSANRRQPDGKIYPKGIIQVRIEP